MITLSRFRCHDAGAVPVNGSECRQRTTNNKIDEISVENPLAIQEEARQRD